MSMDLMVKAMKTKVGNPLRKLVLLKLADNASDQGECWPSYQYIADQCEISKRVVQLHIKALEKTGVLTKTVRKGVKGNSSNVYILNFHLLKPVYNEKGVICGYLLPSESDAPPSESDAPPSESDALGGVNQMHPEPVTLEPVNESVSESTDILSDSDESNVPTEIDPAQKFGAQSKRAMLIDAFEYFWNAYQHKTNRKAAEKSFLKIALTNDRDESRGKLQLIIDRAKCWGDLYASAPADQKQFQPNPATWINNERWNDEQLPTIRKTNASTRDWATEMINEERF